MGQVYRQALRELHRKSAYLFAIETYGWIREANLKFNLETRKASILRPLRLMRLRGGSVGHSGCVDLLVVY